MVEVPEFGGEFPSSNGDASAEVVGNDLFGDTVELDVASGRQGREVLFDVASEATAGSSGQGAMPQVEPELGVLRADEVQYHEACLAVSPAQATPKLLEKDGGALGGA